MRMYCICTYKHATWLIKEVEQTEHNTELLELQWETCCVPDYKNITNSRITVVQELSNFYINLDLLLWIKCQNTYKS